jgi:hypothetical protein
MLLCPNVPHLALSQRVLQAVEGVKRKMHGQPEETLSVLHDLFFSLWSTTWDPPMGGIEKDPTKLFLALRMATSKDFLNNEVQVTKHIAHLKYCMRLTVLQEMHQSVKCGSVKDLFDALDQHISFLREGERYTFASLCSLSHLASACVLSKAAVPKGYWRDTLDYQRLSTHGVDISLGDIWQILNALQLEMVSDVARGQLLILIPSPLFRYICLTTKSCLDKRSCE